MFNFSCKTFLLSLIISSINCFLKEDDSEYIQLTGIVEPHHPLWTGSLFTYEDRDNAILKGIRFLESKASNDSHFLQYARDYMLGMKLVAQSSHTHLIIKSATRVGKEMSERWKKAHENTNPSTLSNDDLRTLIADIYNVKRYNVDVEQLVSQVKTVLENKTFSSFFSYDPLVNPPKDNHDPKNFRLISKWEEWQNALIFAYVLKELNFSTLEGDGTKLYLAVLNWLPRLKPYTNRMDTAHFIPNLSAVLQLTYTLSDYEFLTLDKDLLSDEYSFLQQTLPVAIDYFQSVEAVGELVDCLKTFGDREDNPNIQRGITYLLAEQNADGSWGGEQEKSQNILHHTTIVALWGLREKFEHGKGPSEEPVLSLLQEQKSKLANKQQQDPFAQQNMFQNNLAQMLQFMGLPFIGNGNLPNTPQIPGLPNIPGMANSPFTNFHTQFSGSGNVPMFNLNDAQKNYMKMQSEQQKSYQQQMEQYQKQMEQYQKQIQQQQQLLQQQQQQQNQLPQNQQNQNQQNQQQYQQPQFVMPPPPPVSATATSQQLQEQKALANQIQDLIDKMNSAKPVPLPNAIFSKSDSELASLKQLLASQIQKGTQPIILPPPAVIGQSLGSGNSMTAPPPPPPPPSSLGSKQDILSMINSAMPKPQRIPAPPVINQDAPSPCCAAPTPGDQRDDNTRCPKIRGTPLPRCKRNPPSILARCRRNSDCSGSIDKDGDVDIDSLQNPVEERRNIINFNPKLLLAKLCPGGNCQTKPVLTASQSGSL
eukprot:c11469_g1_i1.p1 GENE.c11469_g1_i1~~c11469_g1_i1.p1  ORF type:complete len:762 (+),score=361.45 c11469_g1_i1:36-2321(+)